MIIYDYKTSLSLQDCTGHFQNAFGRKAARVSTVKRWYAEFDRGHVSLHDEISEVRPSTAITEENDATVRHLIEENWHITYEEIRGRLEIGMSQIQKILHQYLKVPKLCCRWILHELTLEHKRRGVEI
ncbi:Histone-lysine N-methyltransferase SETMAR [Eumeta japonica]|uniref:Histone-lysine N-methyltransferase SETMAR n=1 Tax=Eumeta variegata TaxID=151549 RepID=A0A4C1XHG9_EUMVA|nr:Histone-lysine N-methyltransferase SETMAR [Eumeta japonica]